MWHGATLQWYLDLFKDSDLWIAFLHSILLGIISSFIATLIGALSMIHIHLKAEKNYKSFFTLLVMLIIVPDLVLGVALLVFFNLSYIPLGFTSLLIAHITFCLPFVILTLKSRIQTLDINLYYSAQDLGASQSYVFRKVILPFLWPGILSAFLLCFTLSFDDVIISYFVASPNYTILPLSIYTLVKTGMAPELNALCTMTILFSMILVIFAHHQNKKTL